MFLPIVMLDRFGWPGVIVFALPNVAGCTIFGYVLSPERSRRLVSAHRTAMRVFSAVTIAYHLFFAGFLVAYLVPVASPLPVLAAPLLLYGAGLVLSRLRDGEWLLVTVVVYLVSLAALLWLLRAGPLPGGASTAPAETGQLAFLAPVIAFGFLLCPYLDLTFHRARQRAASRHAFAVFGATFTVMILLTWLYREGPGIRWVPIVAAHIAAQAVFSVGAHLRELRQGEGERAAGAGWVIAPLLALPVVFVMPLFADAAEAARDTYVRFLVFYGLVFPAYVLIFMARSTGRTRRSLVVFAALVAIGMPAYELGFLHGMAWLVLVPLAALGAWAGVSGAARGSADAPRRP